MKQGVAVLDELGAVLGRLAGTGGQMARIAAHDVFSRAHRNAHTVSAQCQTQGSYNEDVRYMRSMGRTALNTTDGGHVCNMHEIRTDHANSPFTSPQQTIDINAHIVHTVAHD